MKIIEAQKDMRQAYFNGATGAIVSGTLWIAAGLAALFSSQQTSILIFFFGGMLIFPLSLVVSKLLKRSGQHQNDNELAKLAIESTFLIFIGLFIAYAVYETHPTWFYGIMMLIIGGRYVLFQSLYGLRLYWLFGAVLIVAGVVCILTAQEFHSGALMGGVVEIVFAILLFKVPVINA